jgi:hypothetical protein
MVSCIGSPYSQGIWLKEKAKLSLTEQSIVNFAIAAEAESGTRDVLLRLTRPICGAARFV